MNQNNRCTIIDGFFENPLSIIEIAETLPFDKSNGRFPGMRTGNLEIFSKEVSEQLAKKFSQIFSVNDSYFLKSYFQKIKNMSFGSNINSPENSGWVHNDDAIISGLVYLNQDAENYGGTSMYEPLNNNHKIDVNLHKKNHYEIGFVEDEEKYITDKIKFQSSFSETMSINNKFNRAVVFDSNIWHSAQQFVKKPNLERLTLVFFWSKK